MIFFRILHWIAYLVLMAFLAVAGLAIISMMAMLGAIIYVFSVYGENRPFSELLFPMVYIGLGIVGLIISFLAIAEYGYPWKR
jgi:hypothetical protein